VLSSKFVTHTAPSAVTMPVPVVAPTAIVATTSFVPGSIRETVSLRPFTTQTEPYPNVIPFGRSPTGTDRMIEAPVVRAWAGPTIVMLPNTNVDTNETRSNLERRMIPLSTASSG
jgi:hypothetical protein